MSLGFIKATQPKKKPKRLDSRAETVKQDGGWEGTHPRSSLKKKKEHLKGWSIENLLAEKKKHFPNETRGNGGQKIGRDGS